MLYFSAQNNRLLSLQFVNPLRTDQSFTLRLMSGQSVCPSWCRAPLESQQVVLSSLGGLCVTTARLFFVKSHSLCYLCMSVVVAMFRHSEQHTHLIQSRPSTGHHVWLWLSLSHDSSMAIWTVLQLRATKFNCHIFLSWTEDINKNTRQRQRTCGNEPCIFNYSIRNLRANTRRYHSERRLIKDV